MKDKRNMEYQQVLIFLAILGSLITVRGELASYRLPGNILPEKYNLKIITYFAERNFTFDGDVAITVRCVEPTNTIKIHIKDIDIDEDSVEVIHYQKKLKVKEHDYDRDNEFYILKLEDQLHKDDTYTIHMSYKAILTDLLAGYYRSSYTDKTTREIRWLAVTHFEPTDARRAFPCFDEPAMKARFQISMGRKEGYNALSNMPLLKTEPMNGRSGWFWDHFQESVPMSTYLVAFAVTDFVSLESDKSHRTAFRVWARKDAIEQAKYASIIGPKILEYFEEYFNVSYPLPKQDMIAVPDFGAGAMENWGLITYRETSLLYDPRVSSVSQKKTVAVIIAHELAHQWFGNLVSPKWWTDIWLNEGFATYVSSLGVDHIDPEWKMEEYHALQLLVYTFAADALKSSHPVSLPIGDPHEIPQIFDTISYLKGSFLLRMLNNFLTENTFREGVTRYLRQKMFGNAEQDDLWKFLTEKAHEDNTLPRNVTVKTIMDTWTKQTGFPLLTVTRDYENGTATIQQRRYLHQQDTTQHETTTWWVPLTYCHKDIPDFETTKPKLWMKSSEHEVTVKDLPGKDKWIIFNIRASGLYRVNYDEHNWNLLVKLLLSNEFQVMKELNRAQVLEDSLDLARAGELGYDVALDTLLYLEKERAYLPWTTALSNLRYIKNMLRRKSGYGDFKKFMRKLITPLYEEFRYQDETDESLIKYYQRSEVLSWACYLEVGDCVKKMRRLFYEWMEEVDIDMENPIPPNYKSLVYCTAIKHGGEREWEFLWQSYQRENVASERSTILWSLGCTKEIWLLQRYLEWAFSKQSVIRRQDSGAVFSSVCRNSAGYFLAKEFLMTRVNDIYEHHGPHIFSGLISSVSAYMSTDTELDELKNFVAKYKHILQHNTRRVEQALESVESHVDWMKRNYDIIINWLQKNLGHE